MNYLTISEARAIVGNSVLHATQDNAVTAKYDRAIQMVLNLFNEECNLLQSRFAVALVANVAEYELESAGASSSSGTGAANIPGDFTPGAFIRAELSWSRVRLVTYADLAYLHDNSETTQKPQQLAFRMPGQLVLYPTPDQAYTLWITYRQALPEWTAGDANAGSNLIPIPARLVRPALWFGGGAAVAYGESGNLWGSTGWRMFMDYIEKQRNAVNPDGTDTLADPSQYD